VAKFIGFNNNTGIGTVKPEAFKTLLPEGITSEQMETKCLIVDDYRENIMSKVLAATVKHANSVGPELVGNPNATGLHVEDIPLGGRTVGAVYVTGLGEPICKVTTKAGDLMSEVLNGCVNTLYLKHNITDGSSDD